MRTICKGIVITLVAIGIACISTQALHAYQTYGVSQDISLFGNLNQHDVDTWNSPYSNSCVPTATTNAFVYLENKFPGVYGNALVPLNSSDPYADMVTVARNLYNNYMFTAPPPGGTSARNFMVGLQTYMEERVPGVTTYEAQNVFATPQAPAWVQRVNPTWNFLYEELMQGAGVHVNIWWDTGGHSVSLRGFLWEDLDDDNIMDFGEGGIGFMDPWTGAYGRTHIWYDDVNDRLATDYYWFGATSTWIPMVMSISPVPEPSLMLLLGTGLLGIVGMKERSGRRRRTL